MAPTNDPFSAPATGDKFDAKALKGALLLITPTGYEEGITTDYGEKDAVKADVVVLDDKAEDPDVEAGHAINGGLIFQGVLISQTKPRVGKGMVLGRLVQRPATKKGQNPAWALDDPTDADKVVAREYLAKADPFE